MTPGSGSSSPALVTGAEKQAVNGMSASDASRLPDSMHPSAPDVTEPSSSSLNQTSKGQAAPVLVSTSAASPAVREPVQDEITITESGSKPVTGGETPVTTSESLDIPQDEYMTTRTWIPDHALPAEHRQSFPVAVNASSPTTPDRQAVTQATTSMPWDRNVSLVSGSSAQAAVGPIRSSVDFPDEIRISEPASDSLVPESVTTTTSESNLTTMM